ncbi:malectin domain-containing carbohydrate-binding protein [Subsaxibacter sp. CAU 1640]|uniref:glycoside hydrolase family 2 TIM barrel-domain containing protein n=1 Tax=Subsaxibacter sp. CAU 1640 TaxID=2933271 RepID=UPI0020063A13|nr:glycoside hydrolase family 2 TIM barrel-domain containing protein [Subsaxibacter sp. CAU 1640]MCK7590676.1 malectin domain-containing carbohydrate-binding protein [Subsaxibacter sp. CAU 1640]
MFQLNIICLMALWMVFSFTSFSQQQIINSGWQFSEDKTNWETINIPHTWNDKDAFDDEPGYRRGKGYYKKQLFLSKSQSDNIHYLKFNAVNQDAKVFVNGQEVGTHKGGYTAFNYNITKWLNYDDFNLIEVTVDNSHDDNIPPLNADFTFYGGIYRDVELISVPKQHISLNDFASDGFYVNYSNVSNESAEVDVTVLVDNFDNSKSTTQLELSISYEGKVLLTKSETVKLNANASTEVHIKFPKIQDPKLWSPESPSLYKLQIKLSDSNKNPIDFREQSIAFRWCSVDPNTGFSLNGKPYKLIGVNRHQDYESFGNAVPLHLQEKDIHLIKNMGANVIRFAHYPHRRELYKLCDELGILVWTEIPIVNKVTNTKEFFQTSIDMQKEHIKQYYNYPSVVMFGYMNEIFLRLAFDRNTEEEKEDAKVYTYELAKQLEDLTRKLAPNRLTVMALHFNELYNETKIADLSMLIGWNLYFGWYHDTIEDLGVFLDKQHRRYPNRSIMVSEYGPGTDARISTDTPKKYDFSQEYQLKLHSGYYRQVKERDFVTGMTAWNFADFGSEFRGDAIPHVNQKGLVQYNREPKDIYYWYKSVLDKNEPFVHMSLHTDATLNIVGKNDQKVTFFSNQKEVELFLKGNLLKTLKFVEGIAEAEIPFTQGKNTLRMVSNSFEITENLDVALIQDLSTDLPERLGINIGSHFNVKDSENGITFVADRLYSKGLFGHIDGEVFNINKENHQGIPQNIKNTNADPLYQTMLEGCSTYKVDVPDGNYRITLYFVEPQLKSEVDIIYNLKSKTTSADKDSKRVFDVIVNDETLALNFNMSQQYSDKYGITVSGLLKIKNSEGLTINLKPIEGKTVISGLLIEKL